MRGRLIDLSMGLNRRQRITIEIDQDFRENFVQLKDFDLDIEIKRHRNRRSLAANSYAWVLIDKIAEAVPTSKTQVYRDAIRQIGGVSDTVCLLDKAVDRLRRDWHSRGLGWQTDVLPSKLPGCADMVLYYGSSSYDTKQMSLLIDQLVQEAKGYGIETATPEQLARYKEDWNK